MATYELDSQVVVKDHGVITLYRRPTSPKIQCRIKVNGSKGYKVRSTGHTDTFKARQAAEALYDSLLEKFKSTGTTVTKTFAKTVSEFLASLRDQDKKASTVEEFEAALDKYPGVYFKGVGIDAIQEPQLIEYVEWRRQSGRIRKRPSDATIQREFVPLRQVFEFAYAKGYIGRQPKLPTIRARSQRRPAFTEHEWKLITGELLDDWVTKGERHPHTYRDRFYLRAYVLLVGNSGIRPGSEHRSLTWKCIDTKMLNRDEPPMFVLRVPKSKTQSRWVVPAQSMKRVVFELQNFRIEELGLGRDEFNFSEPMFCHADGSAVASFKKGFRAFLEEYNLLRNVDGDERTPYSLRHTYATRMIEKGVKHYNLAQNMGTSVALLERHYVHSDYTRYASELA